MADSFDPYREALVMETETIWPEELDDLEPAEKGRIADALHSKPADCAGLEYLRIHTGFTRRITVSSADVERVGGVVRT
jgi:hypothetical protein